MLSVNSPALIFQRIPAFPRLQVAKIGQSWLRCDKLAENRFKKLARHRQNLANIG